MKKRESKFQYRLLITLFVINVVYHCFLKPRTIGHDYRYSIFIIGLPWAAGLLALAYYRRDFLIEKFRYRERWHLKLFGFFFYFIEGVITSFVSFCFVAILIWNCVNSYYAGQSNTETIYADLSRQDAKGRRSFRGWLIEFEFKGEQEHLRVGRKFANRGEELNSEPGSIAITCRQGIWNFYVVDECELIE